MDDVRLDDKVALITGGTRGIGLAAARQLGRAGATVVLVGTDAGRAAAVAQDLVSEGIDALGRGCQVADRRDVEALAESLGPMATIDILVLSAGVMAPNTSKTLRTTDDQWREGFSVNLDGAFHAIQQFVPGMVERRSGRVIGVSSCLGRFSGPGTNGGLAPYRVSKAALNALVKNLASELQLGRRGVLADVMCPGHCRTDMGGPNAPRSAEEGADTIAWLAMRTSDATSPAPTGLLWEDRVIVPW